MRFREFIIESYQEGLVSQEFDDFLQNRGYQLLASGTKRFYQSPKSDRLLVVVQPAANKEFLDWVNFCNQNANDPHLPKYSKLTVLDFPNPTTGQQEQYTTVFTERLRENSRGTAIEAMEYWASIVETKPSVVFSKALEAFMQVKQQDDDIDSEETLKDLYNSMGGYQGAGAVFNTVKKTVIAGQRLGYQNDLMDDNIMLNPSGTLVINDPWANI